jgi:hypothetical protein
MTGAPTATPKLKQPMKRPELFLIEAATIAALSIEEVFSTYDDMEELGIAELPYPDLDIGMEASVYFVMPEIHSEIRWGEIPTGERIKINQIYFKEWHLRFCFRAGQLQDALLSRGGRERFWSLSGELPPSFIDVAAAAAVPSYKEFEEFRRKLPLGAEHYKRILIVLLGTRNIVKTRHENKALRLGIGLKNEFKPLYTTTLSLPSSDCLEALSGSPPPAEASASTLGGYTLRPHLRRGHIRRQRYGPRNSLIRQVWIPAVFINADENFISARTAYNTSLRPEILSHNQQKELTT